MGTCKEIAELPRPWAENVTFLHPSHSNVALVLANRFLTILFNACYVRFTQQNKMLATTTVVATALSAHLCLDPAKTTLVHAANAIMETTAYRVGWDMNINTRTRAVRR